MKREQRAQLLAKRVTELEEKEAQVDIVPIGILLVCRY